MNECRAVRRLLALPPADRSPGERRRVEEHLATCADCAAAGRAYALQDHLLQSPLHVSLTTTQRNAFITRLERQRRSSVVRRRLSIILGAAFGLIALVALAWGVYFVILAPGQEPIGPVGLAPTPSLTESGPVATPSPPTTREAVATLPPVEPYPPVGPESYPTPNPQPSPTPTPSPTQSPTASPSPVAQEKQPSTSGKDRALAPFRPLNGRLRRPIGAAVPSYRRSPVAGGKEESGG